MGIIKKFINMNLIEKSHLIITLFIKVSLIFAIGLSVYEQNWITLFVGCLTLLLVFSPNIFERRYNLNIPVEFELVIVIFMYFSLFLGEIGDFYSRFWWWDMILHTSSGIALGFIGFLILYGLNQGGKFSASPKVIALFSFCFALALGALWEIFEFSMDIIFAWDMQKARNLEEVYGYCDTHFGVIDTMVDLIVDSIGALIASLIGYLYLIKGEVKYFDKFITSFERDNPHIFRKK
jgi:hypothetical protein